MVSNRYYMPFRYSALTLSLSKEKRDKETIVHNYHLKGKCQRPPIRRTLTLKKEDF